MSPQLCWWQDTEKKTEKNACEKFHDLAISAPISRQEEVWGQVSPEAFVIFTE